MEFEAVSSKIFYHNHLARYKKAFFLLFFQILILLFFKFIRLEKDKVLYLLF